MYFRLLFAEMSQDTYKYVQNIYFLKFIVLVKCVAVQRFFHYKENGYLL